MGEQYQVHATASAGGADDRDGNFYMGRNVVPPQLADEVYIFYDKDQSGIHFFDRTPKKQAEAHPGKYQTDIPSISSVEWDDKINEANSIQKVLYPNNSNTVTTIILSVEEYVQVLEQIMDAKANENQTVFFDFEDKIKLIQLKEKVAKTLENNVQKSENMDNANDLEEILKELKADIYRKNMDIKKNLNSESPILSSKDIAQADKNWQLSEDEMVYNTRTFEQEFEMYKNNENDITKE